MRKQILGKGPRSQDYNQRITSKERRRNSMGEGMRELRGTEF